MNSRQVQSFINNSAAIRQEIQRFESVHPSIYAIYDLIELIPDPLTAQQIRDHVVCIEGMLNYIILLNVGCQIYRLTNPLKFYLLRKLGSLIFFLSLAYLVNFISTFKRCRHTTTGLSN